jgi:integrase
MGYLYRPKLKKRPGEKEARESSVWWCKYYLNGRPVRESTGARKQTDARRFLKEREGKAVTGAPIMPRADRVRFEEAEHDLRNHYEATGTRDLNEYKRRVVHLARAFASIRIAAICQPEVDRYVAARMAHGIKSSTIRRELGTLTTLLRLAFRNGKLMRVPMLTRPKEGPARSGFLEPAQYAAIRRHLPDDLATAADVGYVLGWRVQSEILTLERRHVDLESGTLRLDAARAKNRTGRVVYIPRDLREGLRAQLGRVRAAEKKTGKIIPYLFPFLSGPHRLGVRRRDFRKAWAAACKAAGLPGALKHDMRRSAARNLVRAGVPEAVCMKITGHKTRSVFDRYNIVSAGDLLDAARKLETSFTGTFSGTFGAAGVDARAQVRDNSSTGG